MKQLHTFDEVFDSQKVFRQLLNAMSYPGRRCSIQEQEEKLFGKEPALLALAITLLDASVRFCAPGNPELTEQIILLTHAQSVPVEEADYLFFSTLEELPGAMKNAKEGTLENPHASATLIIRIPDFSAEQTGVLSGPGVDGHKKIDLPATVWQTIQQRNQKEYEYPQGIDLVFLLPHNELICIPRRVRMEEC